MEQVQALAGLSQLGAIDSYAPFLPLVFKLDGKPYSLDGYKQFTPMFSRTQPQRQLWITARQVAKSTSTAAASILIGATRPFTTTLFVSPRYEQIRRISGNAVRPFIEHSPFRHVWTGSSIEQSVLQKSFHNGSKLIFSFALLDAERIRGIAAHWIRFDEVQDLNQEFIPIIRETISAARDLGIETFTGTAKTRDNTIARLWADSSQAEWMIPCLACNKINIPSLEFDLERMLGPYHEGISEHCPGLICAKCSRPIFPEMGRWVHRYADRAEDFCGYHISQPIMRLHYANKTKWRLLLNKRDSNAAAPHIFINEVLGESASTGNQLIALDELIRAAVLPWDNNPRSPENEVRHRIEQRRYRCLIMGVDWGGGGKDGVSYTTLAVMGWLESGRIEVIWGKRLLSPNDHLREAQEILHWCQFFNCRLIAHDYTGAGVLRETFLVQAGFPVDQSMPMRYVGSASRSLLQYIPATPDHQRSHYNLDRTRSLLTTINAIRTGQITFFRDDYRPGADDGLLRHFLSLVDEKVESFRAGDAYLIRRAEGQSDDFAHAVNLGASALYHIHDAWPDFSSPSTAIPGGVPGMEPLTDAQLQAFGHGGYGWEHDQHPEDFLMTGDFQSAY